MRIDEFPKFTPINIDLRNEVNSLVRKFEPYSDFNFVSLFSWDTNGSTQLSILNGNLVILLPDYLSNNQNCSIIGENEALSSAATLLETYSILKLVPEVFVEKLKQQESLEIGEDFDNFDYVYKLKELALLPGGKYKSKRNKSSRFLHRYGDSIRIDKIDFSNPQHRVDVLKVFNSWVQLTQTSDEDARSEALAINKLLQFSQHLPVFGHFIFIENSLAGFSIHERIDENNAVCHFHKTITSYENIDVYFTSQLYRLLLDSELSFVNWEQDLGIPGLRHTKTSYHPAKMLKKYTIKKS